MIKNFLFGFGMIFCLIVWAIVVALGSVWIAEIFNGFAGLIYLGTQIAILGGFLFALAFRES